MYQGICFEITADNAMFSSIESKVAGEKKSYDIPTYDALRGIVESIYWKPTLVWVIDKVRICNKIEQETKAKLYPRMYDKDSGGADRAYATYLKNVKYQVQAHFEWADRDEFKEDRNADKHLAIANRCIEKGGRRLPFLGEKDGSCYGMVSPCVFGEGKGAYDNVPNVDFGFMYHGITYPTRTDSLMKVRFWRPVMKYGVIEFIPPEDCVSAPYERVQEAIRWSFGKTVTSVDKEWEETLK